MIKAIFYTIILLLAQYSTPEGRVGCLHPYGFYQNTCWMVHPETKEPTLWLHYYNDKIKVELGSQEEK